jgi:hypothetical protein
VEMEFRPQGFACRINAGLAGNAPAGVRSEDHTVQG